MTDNACSERFQPKSALPFNNDNATKANLKSSAVPSAASPLHRAGFENHQERAKVHPVDIEWLSGLLELKEDWLSYRAMTLRAVIVFISALIILRIGSRRFLSKLSPFDVLLAIMVGSISSRAITGNSAFGPSILTIAVLVGLHWLLGFAAYHTDGLGTWLKGSPRHLVKAGEIQQPQMQKAHITKRELEECTRSTGVAGGIDAIEDAWLERDGSISVVPKKNA